MRGRVLAGLAVILAAACGGGGGGDPADATPTQPNNPTPQQPPQAAPSAASVSMQSSNDGYGYETNSFSPNQVRVRRGGTVTWSNSTGIAHSVTFTNAAGVPASVPSPAAGENSRTFNTSGTFSYQCTHHAGMAGTVTVE